MSSYRLGDKIVSVLGEAMRLRLTNAALAEIANVLETETPKALAVRLRKATVSDWNVVLKALANPRPTRSLSTSELRPLMPTLSAVIADGLTS